MQKELQRFLDWKAPHAPRAAVVYKTFLTPFVRKVQKEPHQVTVSDIVEYQQRLKASGRDTYYPMVVIKNFFRWMLAERYKIIDPWLIRLPKKKLKRREGVTELEFKKMEAITSKTYQGVRSKLMLHFLWHCGVRVSELTELKISDMDLEKRKAVIKNKKNSTFRSILWPEETQKVLIQYLGVTLATSSKDNLFSSKKKQLTVRQVQRIVGDLANEAGIQRQITPHLFRHGWTIYRRDRGAQITFLQKGLGHTTPLSTMVYDSYSDPAYEREAQKYLSTQDA